MTQRDADRTPAGERTEVVHRPIGVFDSGIGGLTVVRAIRAALPGEEILYFGDSARVPYGSKSPETVLRFTRECVSFLSRRGVKLLVVACNTASAVALPHLEGELAIPLIGVIHPGVQAAIHRSRRGHIGVIGTEGTVASGAYRRALEESGHAVEIHECACPLFVPLAEEGWIEGDVPLRVARTYLAPLLEHDIDTLILGCTHYPLLRGVIAEIAGGGVELVDSAEETARETAAQLRRLGLTQPRASGGGCRVFVSDRPRRFAEIGESFLGEALDSVTLVDQGDLPWYER
jgi:glutamate racemase